MTVFNQQIKELAKDNDDFRREVATGPHAQVVLMCLQPGEDIGEEVHADTDQLFLVPAGMRHNLRNTGEKRMRLATIYAPPHHPAGTVHATREDAMRAEQAEAH